MCLEELFTFFSLAAVTQEFTKLISCDFFWHQGFIAAALLV
jgi:hypothetical protein